MFVLGSFAWSRDRCMEGGGEGGWGSFLHFFRDFLGFFGVLRDFWDPSGFWVLLEDFGRILGGFFGMLEEILWDPLGFFKDIWGILEGFLTGSWRFLGDSLGFLGFCGILMIFGGFWKDSWGIFGILSDFDDSWGILEVFLTGSWRLLRDSWEIFGILQDFEYYWRTLEGFLGDSLGFWGFYGILCVFKDIWGILEGFLTGSFGILRILGGFFKDSWQVLWAFEDSMGFFGGEGGFWDFSKDYWGIQLSRVWWTSAETSLEPWNNIENNR